MRRFSWVYLLLAMTPGGLARAEPYVDRPAIETAAFCTGVLQFVVDLSAKYPLPDGHAWPTPQGYNQAIGGLLAHAKTHYQKAGLTEDEAIALIARGIETTIALQNQLTDKSRLEVWSRSQSRWLLGLALAVGSQAAREDIYKATVDFFAPILAE